MDINRLIAELVEKVERRYLAKYRGLVVDNDDPEQLGRLKLSVPDVLGPEVVTGWAMPCLPYGGMPGQGSLWVPDVGAGVWVEFEAGDLEYPVWVGTYWSKPDGETELPVPVDADGAAGDPQSPPTRKIFTTARGHTLQFEDADGEEMVLLADGVNAHLLVLDANGIKLVDGTNGHELVLDAEGIRLTDGVNSGNEVVLNGDGVSVTDANGHTIVLDSSGITIESAGDVNIKGQNVTIEAQAQLTAKGNPIHLNP